MEKVVKKSVKSRIVSAAWQLFYEKGYNGTTVDDIIELSETSKGSFYYYFSTKDELLNTLSLILDEFYEELEQKLRTEHIAVKMDLEEVWDDRDILCTAQMPAAVCSLFYTLIWNRDQIKVTLSGRESCLTCIAEAADLEEGLQAKELTQAALECRKLAVAYLDSIGYDVKISRSGKKELISVTFQVAGKAVRNRYD